MHCRVVDSLAVETPKRALTPYRPLARAAPRDVDHHDEEVLDRPSEETFACGERERTPLRSRFSDERGVHPRKWAVVSLAGGCVAAAASERNPQEDSRHGLRYRSHLRRVHPSPLEEELDRRERGEEDRGGKMARGHPRKYAVVSLAEGCVAPAASERNPQEDSRHEEIMLRYLRRVHPPHHSSITRRSRRSAWRSRSGGRRRRRERRVVTRVSTPS